MRLDRRLQAFDDRRNALLDEMEALEPGKLLARPREGKWSILEIVEHLVLAERVVFQELPEPSQLKARKRRLKHRIRYLLVMFVLRADIPVGVISTAMLPRGGRDLAELRRLWDENQIWLRACVDSLGPQGIHRAVLRHPVAGPISVRQAVIMSRIHLERHIRQIRTLQKLLA
jgi:DinB family protein